VENVQLEVNEVQQLQVETEILSVKARIPELPSITIQSGEINFDQPLTMVISPNPYQNKIPTLYFDRFEKLNLKLCEIPKDEVELQSMHQSMNKVLSKFLVAEGKEADIKFRKTINSGYYTAFDNYKRNIDGFKKFLLDAGKGHPSETGCYCIEAHWQELSKLTGVISKLENNLISYHIENDKIKAVFETSYKINVKSLANFSKIDIHVLQDPEYSKFIMDLVSNFDIYVSEKNELIRHQEKMKTANLSCSSVIVTEYNNNRNNKVSVDSFTNFLDVLNFHFKGEDNDSLVKSFQDRSRLKLDIVKTQDKLRMNFRHFSKLSTLPEE